MTSPLVGIVVVTHAAARAARVTLASLRRAHNDVPLNVVIVDNASPELDRLVIREAADRHIREAGLPWAHVQLDRNLGFAGGNNVGIQRFLADDSITHVCLLNSDVIVTDHWLDRLVDKNEPIVGAVTNRAESEQCVPIDYDLEIDKCLDEEAERLPDGVFERVQRFADGWHAAWRGHVAPAEPTFFCVLIRRDVFERVGLLDEAFFPGGYEDDDFCLRAKQAGIEPTIARDAFMHHWGSASFGQVARETFATQAQRNRERFETKHGVRWRRRPEKPFVSFAMDVEFAAAKTEPMPARAAFIALYERRLTPVIHHFATEFRNIHHQLAHSGLEVPTDLAAQIARMREAGELAANWQAAVALVEGVAGDKPPGDGAAAAAAIKDLAVQVHDVVECNFAMHALIHPPAASPDPASATAPTAAAALNPAGPSRRLHHRAMRGWSLFLRGLRWWLSFRGIVFFGGYPYPERQNDGYFQRIQLVDRLFGDEWRLYVESDELPGRVRWLDRPEDRVLVLRILGSPTRRLIARTLAVLAALRCRRVYFHSVLRMRDNGMGSLLYVPWMRRVFDVHGVVPEEFRFHADYYSAVLYEAAEELAVRKSTLVVVVTNAMRRYLEHKYRVDLGGRVVVFPMFPNIAPSLADRPAGDGKPVVVYAGGLHKWQQVPKMIEAIAKTHRFATHKFYCPSPDQVQAMLPPELVGRVEVGVKTQAEMAEIYPRCHYGFILREDNIVNNVACPTKLVEYVAMGVVPIVDSPAIGDFRELGLHMVTLEDFLAGRLPDEATRQAHATANFALFDRLRHVRQEGARTIHDHLVPLRGRNVRLRLRATAARWLPANTVAGRLARRIAGTTRARHVGPEFVPDAPGLTTASTMPQSHPPDPTPCDVLVQVDNFEAGGLENFALAVNDALASADRRVALLVLGTAGAAVERARAAGTLIQVGLPTPGDHGSIAEAFTPGVVVTHYSTSGLATYRERGIPVVQVLHNIYMWFDEAEGARFRAAADSTTLFLAVSEAVREYSIARLGVPESRSVVVAAGGDMTMPDEAETRRQRAELRQQLGIGAGDFVFLSVGAINHQKNHIAEVLAFSRIAGECPRARLVILGPAYEKALVDQMLATVARESLDGRVIYAGQAPASDPYFAMADAFVSASYFEGGPLTLLEALRANIPVVMTRVGLAVHFERTPGITLVEPPVAIDQFRGRIWELASPPDFVERFAEAMRRTYATPRRPDLPADLREAMDRRHAFRRYADIILAVADGQRAWSDRDVGCWTSRLAREPLDRVAAS
jgi:GT2 family glycosyltransferase/glycosyltransferase involved in cell wall biosynthesis